VHRTGVRVGADCKGGVPQAMLADDHSFCRQNCTLEFLMPCCSLMMAHSHADFAGARALVVSPCPAAGPSKPAKRDCHDEIF